MPTTDLFADLRKQARQVLAAVFSEIREREAELQELVARAEQWRAALGTSRGPGRPRGSSSGRGTVPAKPSGGQRVSWDAVLNDLPWAFTIDDVMKRPGVKARGRDG